MALDHKILTMVAKKDYSEFAKELNKEVEFKMKHHLAGFNQFLDKNAFKKEEE